MKKQKNIVEETESSLKQEAKDLGLSEESLKNVFANVLDEAKAKSTLKNFRPGWDIPLDRIELECKIEGIIRKGGAKLSDLFLCFHSMAGEGDKWLELPDSMLRDLRENLKDFHPDLGSKIDTHKILVFYGYWFPGNYILDRRKFNYPAVAKISTRQNKVINGKASHLN